VNETGGQKEERKGSNDTHRGDGDGDGDGVGVAASRTVTVKGQERKGSREYSSRTAAGIPPFIHPASCARSFSRT
jgi:hypothetical protein